jgi:Hsp70 protein
MYDPLGLSIGTTNLVAVRNESPPVTRRAVLTLYPHCAPKVGVPEENPNVTEPGTLISGFVERVGGSVALLSGDGSAHDPDLLMVEALDTMVDAAGADASSSEIAIAVPAYWKQATVQALRDGLRTHVGFVRSGMAPRLVSDVVATLTAVNSEVGLPDEGLIGLLDFGGTGTSATLVQLGEDFAPVSPTLRHADFSGSEVDHELLLHVYEQLGHAGDADSASNESAGQISMLREQCQAAKERLSTDAVTELATDFAGYKCNIRVTRDQLEDLIQDRLTSFIYAFDHMLVRYKKGWPELAALVAVGGSASIPLVTHRLSRHARIPILTVSQPAVAAANGALLLASRGELLDMRTRTSISLLTMSSQAAGTGVIQLPAGDVMVIDQDAMTDRELAWSQTEFPGAAPTRFRRETFDDDDDGPSGWSMRLSMMDAPRGRPWRRLRLSQAVIGLCAAVAVTAIGGVAVTLASIENREAPPTPSVVPLPVPSVSAIAPSPVPPPPSAAPIPSAELGPSAAPPPSPPPPVVATTPFQTAPPPVVTTPVQTTPPRPTTTARPTPTTTARPTPTTTTTTPPPTTTPPTTTTTTTTPTTVPMTTEWLRIPLLPVPIPVQVPQNQAPVQQSTAPVQQYPQYPQNPFLGPGGY